MAAVAGAVLAIFAPLAGAAPLPGTPVTVAPGVPGHGRAWELVTSPDVVTAQMGPMRALSPGGDRFFYTTIGALPGAPAGKPLLTSNLASRGPDGWVNVPKATPEPESAPLLALGVEALSPDLSARVWAPYLPLRPGETSQEIGLVREEPEGAFALMAEIGPGADFVAASTDLQHVVFTTPKHLLAADAGRIEGASVYELVGSTVRLVDVDDAGALLSNCGSTVSGPSAISRDGRRIYISSRPSCAGTTRVYLRADGATTTEISASQCELPDCGPARDVSFVGATPSGSRAFLVTAERLTDDDLDSAADLYGYDVGGGGLTLLSGSPDGPDVPVRAEPVATSADGSRVFFRTSAPSPEEGPGVYLADESGRHPVAPSAQSFLQASADGRYLLFATHLQLGSGDSDERVDVYRYDAAAAASTPVSAAAPGAGNGPFDALVAPESHAEFPASSHPYRAISQDGSRLFFSTPERLLPEDSNEVVDVYGWENGDLALVSAGASDRPALYLGTTPDGATVFFRTSLTLLPRDRDGGDYDVYVARIGGGFAEPAPAAACTGGSCRAPGPGRLDRASPPSSGRAGGIRVRRVDRRAGRSIVATGWITLLAEVPRPGHLFAKARARVGGRYLTVASAGRDVAAGPVRLRMRLSDGARRRLAAGRDLQVRLVLRLDGLRPAREVRFELQGGR